MTPMIDIIRRAAKQMHRHVYLNRSDCLRLLNEIATAPDADAGRVADLDAGRELMRRAWHELNAIRARDGAPSGVSDEWWSEITDGLGVLLDNDTVPWMLGAANELVKPHKARIAELERRIERALEALDTVVIGNRSGHDLAKSILRGERP